MIIYRKDLLHEISNLAYVIADVSEGKESPHALHQTFDICEEGNIDRVDSLLVLAAVEVAAAIAPLGKLMTRKGDYYLIIKESSKQMTIREHPKWVEAKVAGLIREYMVAAVLHGWLSVTLPSAAPFWAARKEQTAAALGTAVASANRNNAFTRSVPPF